MKMFGPTRGTRHLLAQVAGGFSILFCLAVLATPGYARETDIKGVRVWPSPERTRIVFDLTHPVQHRIFSLSKPDRLVIDIDNTRLDTSLEGIDYSNTPIKETSPPGRTGSAPNRQARPRSPNGSSPAGTRPPAPAR